MQLLQETHGSCCCFNTPAFYFISGVFIYLFNPTAAIWSIFGCYQVKTFDEQFLTSTRKFRESIWIRKNESNSSHGSRDWENSFGKKAVQLIKMICYNHSLATLKPVCSIESLAVFGWDLCPRSESLSWHPCHERDFVRAKTERSRSESSWPSWPEFPGVDSFQCLEMWDSTLTSVVIVPCTLLEFFGIFRWAHVAIESPYFLSSLDAVSPRAHHFQVKVCPCRNCRFRVPSPVFRISRVNRFLSCKPFLVTRNCHVNDFTSHAYVIRWDSECLTGCVKLLTQRRFNLVREQCHVKKGWKWLWWFWMC